MSRTLRLTALAAALATAFSATASDENAIVVTANRFSTTDVEAPYASEVHTRAQIESSGAVSLYDYLGKHTSVVVAPSFGNRASPKLDLRGYGIENGHQNVAIIVDGVRLNGIDLATPLLGGIALNDVERIEISKGSGVVTYGDGAMAGTIQIHTRRAPGSSASVYAGNFGAIGGSARATRALGPVTLAAAATRDTFGGTSVDDATGHRDASRSDTWQVFADARMGEASRIRASVGEADVDTRYVGTLTQGQLDQAPEQNSGIYTHQLLATERWRVDGETWLGDALRVSVLHQREDRRSEFLGAFPFTANYRTDSSEFAVHLEADRLTAIAGVQHQDGDRLGRFDTTTKENTGVFAQAQLGFGPLSLIAGARRETVDYRYAPTLGTANEARHSLGAWDVGANLRVDSRTTVFANHAFAFQAPDIDRFFTSGGGFNAFIAPARSRTTNLGMTLETTTHSARATAFYARVDNEIYYFDTGNFFTSFNTNIDESHKYGVELSDQWRASETVAIRGAYSHTRAIIDREDQGGGAFNGKDLPGVSRHAVTAAIDWRTSPHTTLVVAHTWRSSTWSANDFDNNDTQRQRAYQSTQLSYRYAVRDDLEINAAVTNLFERTNGLWIADDAVYPVDFARIWQLGMKVGF